MFQIIKVQEINLIMMAD